MAHSYLDFELEIGIGQGREYPVTVLRSPAGEARATMHFPFGELQLESHLKDLQIAMLRSGGQRRTVPTHEEQTVQDFGRALFDALISGEVRSLYDVSKTKAVQAAQGLRLKLRIESPQLAALPWEFLYDTRPAEYVCLSVHTPVVRYLELQQPPRPLAVTPPLRILGMIASPNNLAVLDVENEKTRVEQALSELRSDGLIDLEWLHGQTWRDLQRAMRHGPWHIFHFVGHGAFDANADEGLVMLADEQGKARPLRSKELGRLLADHRDLRLAVLNACEGAKSGNRDLFSSTASILVRQGLPAVMAMQYDITDRAAVELSRAFYESVAEGLPVDAALAEARKAVSLAVTNTVEWGTPVLYMRASDGVLFDLAGPAKVVAAPIASRVEIETTAKPAFEAIQPKAQELMPTETPAQPVVRPASATTVQKPRQRSLGRVLRPIVALAVVVGIIILIANRAGIFSGAPMSTPGLMPLLRTATPTVHLPPIDTLQIAQGVINGATLNVRSGPDTNYSAIGQARNSERYTIIGKNPAGDWYQINYNGQIGWVASQYMVVDGDPTSLLVAANIPALPAGTKPAAAVAPSPAPRLVAKSQINLRQGPGTPYPVVGSMTSGEEAAVLGRNADSSWWQVALADGTEGWVDASLVLANEALEGVAIAQAIPTPVPQAQYAWTYTGSAVSAPQCGMVSFNGQVQYANGSPQNGVCVLIDYYGPRTIKFSGSGGADDGNWGFTPCGDGACQGPIKIYVVECPAGGVPDGGLRLEGAGDYPAKSTIFSANVTDKCTLGQWTNIIFKGSQ